MFGARQNSHSHSQPHRCDRGALRDSVTILIDALGALAFVIGRQEFPQILLSVHLFLYDRYGRAQLRAKKEPQSQRIARTAPKNFLNNSRAVANKTRVLRQIAPENSPESSAKSLLQKFFGVPFLSLTQPTNLLRRFMFLLFGLCGDSKYRMQAHKLPKEGMLGELRPLQYLKGAKP